MKILAVQFYPWDPPGPYLEYCATVHGAYFSYCQTFQDDPVPRRADAVDGLVMLGGAMGACDEKEYPFLLDVIDLILSCHEQRKPVLGICLGAQLIARAFGGRNYISPEAEFGFFGITRTALADADVLLNDAPKVPSLLEFHFDTFDLPEQAAVLMTGSPCVNQAFRIGATTYGFQPHFEASPEMMRGWLTLGSNAEIIKAKVPALHARALTQIADCERHNRPFCTHVAERWFALCAARHAAGTPARALKTPAGSG